jgi:hypothetical protein
MLMINDLNTIRLQNAVFCAECEVISDSPHDVCSVCGSRSLVSLSRVLGGPLPEQRAQLVETAAQNTVIVAPLPVLSGRPRRKRAYRRKHAA